jgi:hypothetical protein
MLHRQANQPRSLFRGNELMRLMTMLVMLAVIILAIVRASDPNTWTWLANDAGAANHCDATGIRAEIGSQGNSDRGPDSSAGSALPSREATEEVSPTPGALTEEDPEEAEAAKEEIQAIVDGTEDIQVQEMFAYNRVLNWVWNQTFAQMSRRARKDVAFNKFYQTPDRYRGQLFKFDLDVRMVRDLDEKYKDVELFDVWGETEESGVWLYNGVIIGLPKGMPKGRDLSERVSFAGYFFKLQGYQPAGAKPGAKPVKAPLFVGRLIWHPSEKLHARPADWSWGFFLLAAFVIFLIIRWTLLLRGGRRRVFESPRILAKPGGDTVEGWLAKVESEEADQE